ncbi:MAG: Lpg1974 family pore-forming outer membrane protein [Cyanobacteria bacterium P01_H01_bin.150]
MKNYFFVLTITLAAILNTSMSVSAKETEELGENNIYSEDLNSSEMLNKNLNSGQDILKSELSQFWSSKQDLLTSKNLTFTDIDNLEISNLIINTTEKNNSKPIEIAQSNSPENSSTIQQRIKQQQLQQKLELLQQKQQQLEQELELLRQQIAAPKPEKETPVVSVPEDKPQNIEVSAQLLFLQPSTSNLMDFAIVDPGASNTLAVSGDVASLDYDDEDSLRIGLTYRPPNTAWDITAKHTSFGSEAEQSVEEPTNGFLFSTITHPFQNESAQTADANAELDLNATDIELGNSFKIGKNLGLRLFGGLHFSDINQKMAVNYDGRDFNNSNLNIDNSFTGFGPRIGSEIKLNLNNGLSLFAKGAGSLLLGELDTEYQETDNNDADVVAQISNEQNSHLVPGMELSFGVSYSPVMGKSTNLNLSLGYEYQHWFNVANSIRFVDSDSPGVFTQSSEDLSLKGFFMQLGIVSEF